MPKEKVEGPSADRHRMMTIDKDAVDRRKRTQMLGKANNIFTISFKDSLITSIRERLLSLETA